MNKITDENKNLLVAFVLLVAWFLLVWFKIPDTTELIGAIKVGLGAVLFKHGGEHTIRARKTPPAEAGQSAQGNPS